MLIKQINQNIQKKYSIGKPVFLNVPKIQNFDSKKQGFLSRLDRLKRQFALKDKRIRPFFFKKNSGKDSVPKNFGIQKAKGKYICFLD